MLKQLQKIGLNQNEIKVYKSCLELGTAKASDIAKNAEINRSTTYGVLENLAQEGLVGHIEEGNIKKFYPQDPDIILDLIQKREKEIKKVLPQLKQLFTQNNIIPKVKFFEGETGVKKIYEDTLKCESKKVFEMIRVKDYVDFPSKEFAVEYVERRTANNITAFILHPAYGDIYKDIYGKQSKKYKRRSRYLPPDLFYLSMLFVYDNKVAGISTREENFGFIIESGEFSSAMKSIHKFLWSIADDEPGRKEWDIEGGDKWGKTIK